MPDERQRETMRARRADPLFHDREKRQQRAAQAAERRLIANHREEYVTFLQEERQKLGLGPYVPRGRMDRVAQKQAAEVTPSVEPSADAAKCPHAPYGLKKLSYGTFCNNCGTRIR